MSAAPRAAGAVLLTGATGAIGWPLIERLRRAGAEPVYALTRRTALAASPGVRPIAGDVTDGAGLGLNPEAADEIRSTVNAIVHAAANTNFAAAPADARRANVDGALNVMAFASTCRRLDRLLALSTTHVAGRRTGTILEDELDHDAGFVNAYEASKYDAERALRRRWRDLPIAVCRLSTVIGDPPGGARTWHRAMPQAVRLMYAGLAPMLPGRADSPVDLVALDHAVDAVCWLATGGFQPQQTWHVCAGADAIPAGELIDLTLAGFAAYRPSWRKRAIERPALVELATFELFRRSLDELGDNALRASTEVVSHFAPQLSFPKYFDNRGCAAVLSRGGIVATPARDAWRMLVRREVEPAAGRTESTAEGIRVGH